MAPLRKRLRQSSRRKADLLIRNMGLFWPKDSIDSRHRQLLGSLSWGGRKSVANFWQQVGIYALYQDFDLVYVGQASGDQGLGNRLTQHMKRGIADRWDRFSWFGFRLVNDDQSLRGLRRKFIVPWEVVLDHVEGVIVEVSEPRLNGQGGKWGKKVPLYHHLRPTSRAKGPD
jgi:hypothetical protein